jgi:hypothetical protein
MIPDGAEMGGEMSKFQVNSKDHDQPLDSAKSSVPDNRKHLI